MNGHPVGAGDRAVGIPYVELPAEILGGGHIQLGQDVTRVGRSDRSEIALDVKHVSRHHAELVRTAEGFRVVNRSRKNPVQVDGVPVTEARGMLVRDGARLRFPGGIELVFRDGTDAVVESPTGELPAVVAAEPVAAVVASPVVLSPAALTPAAPMPPPPHASGIPPAPPVPATALAHTLVPAHTRARQALFAMGVQVVLMLAMGAYLRWGMDDPATTPPPDTMPVARGPEIAMPFDHDDARPAPVSPLADPSSDPVADKLAERLAILEAEGEFARELARLGQAPPRTDVPIPTPEANPSEPAVPPTQPAPPLPADPQTKVPPVTPAPEQDPPVKTPDPPLPARRNPLVSKPPALKGASGELDRATVRLYDLAAIIPALADLTCPRIAPPADQGSREPDRLVVWVTDTGVKTTAQLNTLARLVDRHFSGRARVSHALVTVGQDLALGAPGDLPALVAAFMAAGGQADPAIHDLVRAAGKAAAHYRDWADRCVVLFSADNGDIEAAVETVSTYLRQARVPLYPIVPEAALSDAFWWRNAQDPSIALAQQLKLVPAGAESAVVELPWGMVTMPVDPQATIGAGYAPHAWGRLAASSGGAAYLYAADSAPVNYCGFVNCALCEARGTFDHTCDTCYADDRLAQLEPTAMSRGWYAGRLDECRAAQVLRQVWEGGARARLFGAMPPDGPGPTPAYAAEVAKAREKDKDHRESGFPAMRDAFNRTPKYRREERGETVAVDGKLLGEFRRYVEGQREATRALATRLAGFVPAGEAPPFQQRALAHANSVWAELVACEFTLVQQLLALDAVAQAWTPDVKVMAVTVAYDNFPLCHGARPLLEVQWPGGPAFVEALGRFAEKLEPRTRALGATPWELAIRRAVIRRYRVTCRPIEFRDTGDAVDKRDKDDKEDKADKPDTNRPRKPPPTTESPRDPPPETKAPPPRPDGSTPNRDRPGPGTPRTGG